LKYVEEQFKIVFNIPMEQLWKRMDNVYEEHTSEQLLRVRDYVIEQLALMDRLAGDFDRPDNIEFDSRDKIDYLTWALVWYSRQDPIGQERQVSLKILVGNCYKKVNY
jgi:hypothetical protein